MKWKLIYDKGELGKEVLECESHEEAWKLQHETNPPGPLVMDVYLDMGYMIVRDARRLNSFDQDAYSKAVTDKRWKDEYELRTGKPWQEQHEPKKAAGSRPDIDSEKSKLNQQECLELLGLKPGFTQKQLKEAYREAVKQNHPDKVASLSNEFKALAEKRTKQINQAFDLLGRK